MDSARTSPRLGLQRDTGFKLDLRVCGERFEQSSTSSMSVGMSLTTGMEYLTGSPELAITALAGALEANGWTEQPVPAPFTACAAAVPRHINRYLSSLVNYLSNGRLEVRPLAGC